MKFIYLSLFVFALVGCDGGENQPVPNSHATPKSPSSSLCSDAIDCQNQGLEHVSHGTDAEYRLARQYFSKACQLGESEGCNNLAFLNANGRGGPQSYTLAYRYWKKACSMGNQLGCTNLGLAKEMVAQMHRDKGMPE